MEAVTASPAATMLVRVMAPTTAQPPIRLAVLDSDTGFLQVVANRLDAAGWQDRVLASPVPIDALVSMGLKVLVVDLAVLGAAGGGDLGEGGGGVAWARGDWWYGH